MGAPAYLQSIYEVAEVKVRCNAVLPKKPSELRVHTAQEVTWAAVLQIKKVVYKNRIRLKEFFVDFDKVRNPLQLPVSGNLCKQKACIVTLFPFSQ